MSKDSLFIVIEGLDGSGKTSVSRQLANVLDYSFKGKIKLTFEPHDPSCSGLFIRQVLMKRIRNFTPRILALAFATNRLDHCDREITPWLEGGKDRIVICDRYYLSSLVYQHSPDFSFESVMFLNEMARKPDIIFFISVSDRVCYERMKIRNQPKELFEKNLAETRKKYADAIDFLKTKNNDQIIEIDGSGTVGEVVEKILEVIYAYDQKWKPQQPIISSTLIPHVFSLNGATILSIEDVVREFTKANMYHELISSEKDNIFNEFNKLGEEISLRIESMSFNELGSLFLDYISKLGYKVGNKLPWTHLDCYELEYILPGEILQRGAALLINENQRYDVIMQKAPELFEMSDFMFVFSPGPSELVTHYYERDKTQYLNTKKDNEVATSLFPSTQLVTQEDISDFVLKSLISKLIESNSDVFKDDTGVKEHLLHFTHRL